MHEQPYNSKWKYTIRDNEHVLKPTSKCILLLLLNLNTLALTASKVIRFQEQNRNKGCLNCVPKLRPKKSLFLYNVNRVIIYLVCISEIEQFPHQHYDFTFRRRSRQKTRDLKTTKNQQKT